jgi:hypothetical protein
MSLSKVQLKLKIFRSDKLGNESKLFLEDSALDKLLLKLP